jgi:hypothetical protein
MINKNPPQWNFSFKEVKRMLNCPDTLKYCERSKTYSPSWIHEWITRLGTDENKVVRLCDLYDMEVGPILVQKLISTCNDESALAMHKKYTVLALALQDYPRILEVINALDIAIRAMDYDYDAVAARKARRAIPRHIKILEKVSERTLEQIKLLETMEYNAKIQLQWSALGCGVSYLRDLDESVQKIITVLSIANGTYGDNWKDLVGTGKLNANQQTAFFLTYNATSFTRNGELIPRTGNGGLILRYMSPDRH